jgi:DNA modification methylase
LAKINWTLRTFRLDELTDYYKNPRSLSEKEFKQLKTSLDKFGMIDKPIVNLDSANTIIGGHQRKHVLEASGVKECECWIPDRELTEREVEELNIRLNKNTGSFDFDTLANEFELDDLLEWGFDKGELDLDLWAEDAPEDVEPQIDKAEELRVKWGVETGQLWQLGEHRLICGDCTDKAVVERVMGGERANMMFTSPPYNSATGGFKPDYYGKQERFYQDKEVDKKSKDEWIVFCDVVMNLFSAIKVDDLSPIVWNVMYNANVRDAYGKQIFAGNHPFTVKETICWNKKRGFNIATRGILSRNWELVFVLSTGDEYFTTQGENETRYAMWEVSTEETQIEGVHHAAFPVELADKAIEWFSNQNFTIYDPFLGSGTTLIACERLGRKCRAVEISPAYVAVAIQRWVDVTGGEPVLLDT